nr:MAG TPA: hypothetical protein [Bacteriophage sp.]DAT96756.1 MAG TPA: hypothetical protein [Caudoviricetes sp.]
MSTITVFSILSKQKTASYCLRLVYYIFGFIQIFSQIFKKAIR